MRIKYLFNTLRHLKVKQVLYQIKYRLFKPNFIQIEDSTSCNDLHFENTIIKNKYLDSFTFDFLNISSNFTSWNDASNGMLWAYNLNYMDFLNQRGMSFNEGAEWIDRFIVDLSTNKVGLDPYPIALRVINWIKFICKYWNEIPKDKLNIWNNSLYSQYKLLEKRLEYHLLGNHLLEDAYSLYIASIYFNDSKMYDKSKKLLKKELNEQILSDGAHYEQSPMYHCILLDRLLDCYNISINNICFDGQNDMNIFLFDKAKLMLGHLSAIIYKDESIPLLNDSANGIAPTPKELFDYANNLSIDWCKIALGDCGYRKIDSEELEFVLDIGDIKASYQPGHSHADTFNYELRVKGVPFIVDSGISTYNKNERRQYERSTMAHNTVSIDGADSSEVWGGFRVGRRAKVSVGIEDENYISATHDGFGRTKLHTRIFQLVGKMISITDKVSSNRECISVIHFSPNVEILEFDNSIIKTNLATIEIKGANRVDIISGKVSTQYNRFDDIKIVNLHFNKELEYKVKI